MLVRKAYTRGVSYFEYFQDHGVSQQLKNWTPDGRVFWYDYGLFEFTLESD